MSRVVALATLSQGGSGVSLGRVIERLALRFESAVSGISECIPFLGVSLPEPLARPSQREGGNLADAASILFT